MALFKGPRKKNSSEKGKSYELNAPEPTFTARYLGMGLVREEFAPQKGNNISAKNVEQLLWVLQNKKKPRKVEILISTNISRGLTITELGSKMEMSFQLQNIAFCSTDKSHPKIFSFIAEREGELQCHTFACKTEEKAKEICQALSNAFMAAHSEWTRRRKRQEDRKERGGQISLGSLTMSDENKEEHHEKPEELRDDFETVQGTERENGVDRTDENHT